MTAHSGFGFDWHAKDQVVRRLTGPHPSRRWLTD